MAKLPISTEKSLDSETDEAQDGDNEPAAADAILALVSAATVPPTEGMKDSDGLVRFFCQFSTTNAVHIKRMHGSVNLGDPVFEDDIARRATQRNRKLSRSIFQNFRSHPFRLVKPNYLKLRWVWAKPRVSISPTDLRSYVLQRPSYQIRV
jgi:hypothetical protein